MASFKTAKKDSKTHVFTIILLIFMLLFPIWSFFFRPQKIWVSIALILLFYGIVIYAYCLIPIKIAVSNDFLEISNRLKTKKIPLKDIVSVQKKKVGINFRTFGVGGLFGYFGYFNNFEIWAVTNINKKIEVKTNNTTYVISPENSEKFVSVLAKFIHL